MPEKDTPTHPWFIERRYLPLIIVLVFVILSAVTFTICYRHHAINTEQTLKDDRSTANLVSLVLDEHLKRIVSIMESYSNRPVLLQAVRDKNVEKARERMIRLAKSNPGIDSVIITDKQGTLWAAYPERLEVLGKNFAYRDWYQGVSKDWKPYISDVFLRIVGEKDLAVTASVPFFDETGEVIGILVNAQRTISLSDLIKQVPLDPGSFITITDRKGQIVYSSRHDFSKEILLFPFYPGIKKAMVANNKTVAIDDPDLGGRTRYISFAPVVNSGWTVFVGRDKHSIFLSESAYYIQVTAIAFFLFLSIILFLFYSRKQVIAKQLLKQLQAEKKIRASEVALQESERRLSEARKMAQLGHWIWDIRTGNVEWSEEVFNIFRLDPKEFAPHIDSIQALSPWPEDQERDKELIRRAMEAHEKGTYEQRFLRPDNSIGYYHSTFQGKYDDGDNLISIVGTVQDITERKKAEEALRESEALFRKLFDDHAAVKLIIDPDTGSLIDANEAASQYYGWPRERLKEMKITEINTLSPEEVKNEMELARAKNRIHFEFRHRLADGSIRDVAVFSSSIENKGKVLLHSIIHDITERKRAEEMIVSSERKYRNIFENAIEGIYQATTEGRYVSVNPAYAKILGYKTPEELISSIADVASQIYVNSDERSELINQLRVSDLVEEFEFQAYRKDGTIIWLLANARVIRDEKGNIEYFEGRVQDITLRKRVEDELKNTLDSLRKAVGTTIQVMVSAVETRDPYTAGHQLRSADLARAIATEMGLPKEKIEAIRMAGPIHDIGKLSIPAEILSKPTKLTNIEFSLIKEHSRSGYEILKDVESPWPLAEIVYQHHERMDGSGYPRNLKGEEIIMEARIMAVADVVEAMASHRPYRPGLGIDAALEEIEKNRGTFYDTTVSDACLRLFREKGFQLERT